MMQKIKPSILPGFMELLPREQIIFKDMVEKISKVYEKNGFVPIDTPLIEKEEILLAKSAGETEKQVYRIDKEKTKQALRFDLTVPFARYVAEHMNELTFPFRRYQLGKVYRGARNQKGRYREFYQLDLDIVNPRKLEVTHDAFVLSVAAEAFQAIGLKKYQFQISNRKLLGGLLETLQVMKQVEVMNWVDKYEKVGEEVCLREIEDLIGEPSSLWLKRFLEIKGSTQEVLAQLHAFSESLCREIALGENALIEEESNALTKMNQGIKELEEVMSTLRVLGVKEEQLLIQLKIIRGLDYYTGTVFETFISGYEKYGSICSGGRYDELTHYYASTPMPGVGLSIGMTRLFFVLKEIGFLENYPLEKTMTYLICPLGDTLKTCVDIKNNLEQQGLRGEIYLNKDSLKKQLSYANAQSIPQVIIVGQEEVQNHVFLLKDMGTGEQKQIPQNQITF